MDLVHDTNQNNTGSEQAVTGGKTLQIPDIERDSSSENEDMCEPLMTDSGLPSEAEARLRGSPALEVPLIVATTPETEDITPMDDDDDGLRQMMGCDDPERASWGGQLEFILTCVGYAVGLGNVWRFPYLCYKNGGGAFLVPYVIMLSVVGLPLFFMELAFGQFASLGPITIWRINPLLKGLGYAMVFVSWLIGLYYNVVIAHTLFYMFASMTSSLPWTTCDNPWNTDLCINASMVEAAEHGSLNGTKTPSEEYYMNYVLEQSDSMDDFGVPNWKLLLCLLLCWLIVFFVLLKGIQSLGKVVYFTAIFPYIMLTILLIRGLTLPGAINGIIYYLKPDFTKLADSRVWSDAATQIFYSLSACTGGLIAMSSYNKFDNNCYRDSVLVACINCATSLYSGFVIFSVLGFMAYEKGVDVGHVAAGGPGLAFVVYPEAIAKMPVAPLWAVLFFLMMATLGFGSQFSIMEGVMSAFSDELRMIIIGTKRKVLYRVIMITVSFLLGIPMVCKGGIYMLTLVDYSVSGFPLLVVGLLECVALNWIYGFRNFAYDIELMLGHKPNIYWRACWTILTPAVIIITVIFNMIQFKPAELDGYVLPGWAQQLGWCIALWPILTIPAYFLFEYCASGGYQLLKITGRPQPGWGPAKESNRRDTKYDPRYADVDGDINNGYISSRATIASSISKDALCVNQIVTTKKDSGYKSGPTLNVPGRVAPPPPQTQSLTTFFKSSELCV